MTALENGLKGNRTAILKLAHLKAQFVNRTFLDALKRRWGALAITQFVCWRDNPFLALHLFQQWRHPLRVIYSLRHQASLLLRLAGFK